MATKCPICSSADTRIITNEIRFERKADVRTCASCSLVFLDQDSFAFPKDFYENEYHQTYLTHIEPALLDCAAYHRKMLQATRPWIDRINAVLTGGETVLDFGCSTGHLMMGIRQKTKKIYGYEINKKEALFCREQLGLEVSAEPIDKRFKEGTFDYIVMIFVLEHIADPVNLLKFLKKFLKPRGRLIIVVPNAQDALLQFYDIPSFGRFYYCIEHLFYYSPATLRQVLKLAGFGGDLEVVQEYPVTNHLNWAYRSKPSDVLASRMLVPDVAIKKAEMAAKWEQFWLSVDSQYRSFLSQNGFGDRLWCVVGHE